MFNPSQLGLGFFIIFHKESKMALTLPDVACYSMYYIDLYEVTGIKVGTPILIQNKSANAMNIQIRSEKPTATSTDGNILTSYNFFEVSGGTIPAVWVKGAGKISVQVLD